MPAERRRCSARRRQASANPPGGNRGQEWVRPCRALDLWRFNDLTAVGWRMPHGRRDGLRWTPEGGPLSPLLSNLVLDDLDRELTRREHRFSRYADDWNIYVRSRCAEGL